MNVACVKEIKNAENRVGLMPSHAYEYVKAGHTVYIERGAGLRSGFSDEDYLQAGAVLTSVEEAWEKADMIIKVKEPLESEYPYFREDLILFTYLHLADNKPLTDALLASGVTGVAYETVTDRNGRLPLLRPMSEIAGKLAIQAGEKYLESHYGGKGILVSGVTGVAGGNVLIIGAGAVGLSACKAALGSGARIAIMDRDIDRLAYIDDLYDHEIQTIYSDENNLIKELKRADIVVGSVLIPGDKAPKIVRREHLKLMEPGTVLVDVAIDQGGCFETSRPTTHDDPIYIDEGIVHYCVANIPGAVPKTATQALGNVTLPYGLLLANEGIEQAMAKNPGLKNGLNTYRGLVMNEPVRKALYD